MLLDDETLEESQTVMSWLNAVALENMKLMFVTSAVFQALMFWLNAVTCANIAYMFVTLAVFQALMSWLNVGTK